MKSILFIVALAFASNAFAQTKTLKGYVAEEGRSGKSRFLGVNMAELELDVYLPLNFFSKEQVNVMANCMQKKETHAITVDSTPSVQHGVPTGIPGRTTTTHMPRYDNVRCVPAPGFLEVWRVIVKKHFQR